MTHVGYRAVRMILLLLIVVIIGYMVAFGLPIDQLRLSLAPTPTLSKLSLTINRQEADLVRDELTAANLASQAGKFDQAEEFYRKAIALAPTAQSYALFVTMLVSEQSIPQAATVLGEALTRFPSDVNLLQLQADLNFDR
jgi:tetratricopeptide (TPR) repeat protein